jgi:hypothetical protein
VVGLTTQEEGMTGEKGGTRPESRDVRDASSRKNGQLSDSRRNMRRRKRFVVDI